MDITVQSSLGDINVYKYPKFDYVDLAKVTNTSLYDTEGKIEVKFLSGGVPVPVLILEQGLTITPHEGDIVIIGFIKNLKIQPYVIGFLKGKYTEKEVINLKDRNLTIGNDLIINTIEVPIEFEGELPEGTEPPTETHIDAINLKDKLNIDITNNIIKIGNDVVITTIDVPIEGSEEDPPPTETHVSTLTIGDIVIDVQNKSINAPVTLNIQGITTLGTIVDLEAKVLELETKISDLESRVAYLESVAHTH